MTGLPPERWGTLSSEESLRREVHHFAAPASFRRVKCRPKAVGVANAGIPVVCLHDKTTHDFPLDLIVALVRLLDRSEGSRAAAKEPGAIELLRSPERILSTVGGRANSHRSRFSCRLISSHFLGCRWPHSLHFHVAYTGSWKFVRHCASWTGPRVPGSFCLCQKGYF